MWSNSFQLCVESDWILHWFLFTSFCDWSNKLAPLSQSVKCKTNIDRDIDALVFPRFRQSTFCFSFHWLPLIISFFLTSRCDHFGFVFLRSIELNQTPQCWCRTYATPRCKTNRFNNSFFIYIYIISSWIKAGKFLNYFTFILPNYILYT